jgi:hypothetical protein
MVFRSFKILFLFFFTNLALPVVTDLGIWQEGGLTDNLAIGLTWEIRAQISNGDRLNWIVVSDENGNGVIDVSDILWIDASDDFRDNNTSE